MVGRFAGVPQPFASKRTGFDFAFFLLVLLPPAPFNLPYCLSTLNFPHSLLIT
jgi:hypothetical protein